MFLWQDVQTPRKETGRNCLLDVLLILSVLLATGCKRASAAGRAVESVSLSNGIHVVSIYFPVSTNVSIFTFVPMGLASDGPGQAQWSHLVEHLVIRSTVPADSAQANAETLPDHMRLDFYGHVGNWQEGLSHHHRWLEGSPFTEASLAAEKPRVIAECDFTVRNLATHKFAMAAWSQGFRHGAKHVALKGDVNQAALADVQHFRDARLAVSNRVTVCIVGGLETKAVFAEVKKHFGGLRLDGNLPPGSKLVSTNLDLTWDLDARHLLVTWPIPDFRQERHAALMVAAQALNLQLGSDADLKRQTGMVFAGADLMTPEGTFFFISASLRPGSDTGAVRQAMLSQVERLAADAAGVTLSAMIGRQLAANLAEVPNPQMLKAQTPVGMSPAMLEGNLGLQLGMHEHRYAGYKSRLAKQLLEVSPGMVQKAVREILSAEKATICTLRPVEP